MKTVFRVTMMLLALAGLSSAQLAVQGGSATGLTAPPNPVVIGGKDSSGNAQNLGVSGTGAIQTGNAAGFGDSTNNNAFSFALGGANASVFLGTASLLFNGATWDRPFYCPNTATFSVASTTTQIVAISASTKIRICSYSLNPSTSTAGNVDIVYGTGASCGTGTTTLTGAYTLPASAVVNIGPISLGNGPLITPAAQAVCVRTTTATVAGFLTWAQY